MSQVTTGSERRKDHRKRPLGLIYVELASANGGMLRDLSEEGFAMRAMMPLRAGDETPFAFSLDLYTRLEGQCKVLWAEENGRVAGLQFTELAREMREQLRAWLAENLEQAAGVPKRVKVEAPKNSIMDQLRDELREVTARPEFPNKQQTLKSVRKMPQQEPPEQIIAAAFDSVKPASSEILRIPVEPPPEQVVATATHSAKPASSETPRIPVETPPARPIATTAPSANSLLDSLPLLPDLHLTSEASRSTQWMGRTLVSLGVRMMFLLALLVAGVVFRRPIGNAIEWLGSRIAGPAATETIVPSSKSDNSVPPVISTPPAAMPAPGTTPAATENDRKDVPPVVSKTDAGNAANPEDTTGSGNGTALPAKEPAAATSPAVLPVTHSAAAPQPSATPGIEPGQLEFQAAQDILKKNINAGQPEAVRLLWAAVEKGNTNAEIALANLYLQGKGVAKNCDQTRILLGAAARKGSVQAQNLLDHLQGDSCE